ncbi:hypothetical protein LTR37_000806 [Vermiconidia calcicola]|uniref:Uncharacterized protein n=1 Tax=Vermiconidia calcicola TaxID=1690605 RepID=A0ACC3NYC9_9PEZI|nr:hypothetical protein LTR37_000806 [Vermiconidia calcicola]
MAALGHGEQLRLALIDGRRTTGLSSTSKQATSDYLKPTDIHLEQIVQSKKGLSLSHILPSISVFIINLTRNIIMTASQMPSFYTPSARGTQQDIERQREQVLATLRIDSSVRRNNDAAPRLPLNIIPSEPFRSYFDSDLFVDEAPLNPVNAAQHRAQGQPSMAEADLGIAQQLGDDEIESAGSSASSSSTGTASPSSSTKSIQSKTSTPASSVTSSGPSSPRTPENAGESSSSFPSTPMPRKRRPRKTYGHPNRRGEILHAALHDAEPGAHRICKSLGHAHRRGMIADDAIQDEMRPMPRTTK